MNRILDYKSYFKFLSRNKAFTVINVFGLSVSLMFVILISVYTVQELSVDKFQEKGERVFTIGSENIIGSAWKLKPLLMTRYPEIEDIVPLVTNFRNRALTIEDRTVNADYLFTDTSFFHVFSFDLVQGDRNTVLETPGYAVVSESFARRAFPGSDPLGKAIRLNDSVTVTVNGIMKDIKNSIIPTSDVIVNIEHIRFFNSSLASERFDNAVGTDLFILERENADLRARATDIEEYFKEIYWLYKMDIAKRVVLTPLKEAYFSSIPSANALQKGDWNFVMILMSVGILILLFAVINYINLTVAQAGQRAKEMATRRLLGSSGSDLFLRLIAESTLLILLSFAIGLFFAYSAVSAANDLLRSRIDLSSAATFGNIFVCTLFILALGVVSGIIPAVFISKTKAIDIVRGGFRKKTKMVFSKVFITFQNAITIMVITASIVMSLQINHMINAPLGYNTTNIINISTRQFDSRRHILSYGDEISKLSSVSRVAYGAGTPLDYGNNNTVEYEGRSISFQMFIGDSTYFSMLGINILRDNNTTSTDAIFLSQQSIRELMISEDAPSFKYYEDRETPIAGIVSDFQIGNILSEKSPVLMRLRKREDFHPWSILVEVQGDPYQAYESISEVYKSMVVAEFPAKFIDQEIEDSFQSQRRISKIVMIFCVIAVVLSLLGLLAMSTYFIQQRSREIAVRKVFGSTNREMLIKLITSFISYVLIAFVIATPIIWYIMKQWLSDYSYRIALSPWIFLASGLFCFLIAFVTVFFQSYRAANANPVNRLKAE